jgi:hypothetical protein
MTEETPMKLFNQARYATIASTAALVVALGGTSYAAVLITSGDIKDGTIQTKDVNPDARVTAKSVHNDTATAMSGDKNVLSLNLRPGKYVLTAKAVAETFTNSGYATCSLVGPNGTSLDTSWWYGGAGFGYGTLADQAVFSTGNTGTVQLRCSGNSTDLYFKKLTAVRVASISNLTGADVAKVAAPRTMTPGR